MPLNQSVPLSSKDFTTFKNELADLQGNILKGHGRDHAAHIFLSFKPGEEARARDWVKGLSFTSAQQQIEAAREYRRTKTDAGPFQAFFITAEGCAYFGKDVGLLFGPIDAGDRFATGMKASKDALLDPAVESWDPDLAPDFHALLLIADDRPANVRFLAMAVEEKVAAFATCTPVFGDQQKNAIGEGIEHFGYVDGRSQPVFIAEDLPRESDGISNWDPSQGPELVLVADPLGKPDVSFGSFFVFRKLEENVKGFKSEEQKLANALNLVGEDRELAGAYVIGRFEDGTPVALSDEAIVEGGGKANKGAVPNNFTYAPVGSQSKCPFHSHIRKSNPRANASDKSRQMARRGMTYGERTDDFSTIEDMPEKGVGLLFMSYQKSIMDQFEFIQSQWVNNDNFPQGGVGQDPVIGQGPHGLQEWPLAWGQAATTSFAFGVFVTMLGGEYFFAPSLSGVKAL